MPFRPKSILFSFFIILFTPLLYLIIGKLLIRTKNTLESQKLFISNITHELRGPMSIMRLDSESALEATDSNYRVGLSKKKSQELIDALKTDLAGLKNMANIIRNLSVMASYEYKPGKLELTKVNLSLLLKRLCEVASTQFADKKNIDINIDIDDKLPAYILGNETALGQMITNLLNNAIKYSPTGRTVTASVSTAANEVIMSIKDTGIGISEKDMLRIFDPLYRSSSNSTRKEEGSGLGLAIVGEVVKGHKAKISVKSILNQGTEILINFPAIA